MRCARSGAVLVTAVLILPQAVCTHGFVYVHEFPIVSIASETGGLPDIYAVEKDFSSPVWKTPKLGGKIKKINGQPPEEYIAAFIRTSPEALNWVDPDARYNEMMYGYPEGDSRGRFARRNMWDGEDLRITWENGSDTIVEYSVQLTNSMVKSGKLLFTDTKTLGELCFLSDSELTSKRSIEVETKQELELDLVVRSTYGDTNAPEGYPKPLAFSPEYAMATYAVPGDKETVVLNIRTFDPEELSPVEFVQAMASFLEEQMAAWTNSGYKRLVIDVSNNNGGQAILPYAIMEQLFPDKDGFSAVNMRYSPLTWAYMHTINEGSINELYRDTSMNDFKNMNDFLGPVAKDGSWYTKMWKQDYVQFGEDSYDINMTHTGHAHGQPFEPENIVVISNSMCASACHSLVESLHTQGVRAFAFGGRADSTLPMQPVGGTKGGKVLSYDSVRSVLTSAAENNAIIAAAGDSVNWLLKQLPIRIKSLKINSENKFRDGNPIPLQFVYTAACSRFFLTETMLYNIAETWKKTREVAWGTDGTETKCVDYNSGDRQNFGTSSTNSNGDIISKASDSAGKIIWMHMGRD